MVTSRVGFLPRVHCCAGGPLRESEVATHHLKLHPKYFAEVIAGRKPFEIRFDDRNYRVGDTVVLMEYSVENGATGRQHSRLITYLLDDFDGLIPGYVAFTLGVSMPASSVETGRDEVIHQVNPPGRDTQF
jgi:hypothetical protein